MAYTTEKNLCLKFLKNSLLLFFLLFFLQSHARANTFQDKPRQSTLPIDSVMINNVIAVSHDTKGNLYLATAEGKLIKYNEQFTEIQRYSSALIPMLTSLEASQMLKIFVFYKSNQQFQFFDRFLTSSQTNIIKTKTLSHFSAATLSNDQMIWLFDENNLQLIKYNPILEDAVLKVSLQYFLKADAQIKGLKEYGNRLYLWDNDEILVFDFLGNLIQKLPIEVNNSFTFYKNQLYYPQGNQIFLYDLETMQQKKHDFPLVQEINFAIRIGSRIYLITNDQMKVFQFEP